MVFDFNDDWWQEVMFRCAWSSSSSPSLSSASTRPLSTKVKEMAKGWKWPFELAGYPPVEKVPPTQQARANKVEVNIPNFRINWIKATWSYLVGGAPHRHPRLHGHLLHLLLWLRHLLHPHLEDSIPNISCKFNYLPSNHILNIRLCISCILYVSINTNF